MRRNAEKLLLMQVVRSAAASPDAALWPGFTTSEARSTRREARAQYIGKGKTLNHGMTKLAEMLARPEML